MKTSEALQQFEKESAAYFKNRVLSLQGKKVILRPPIYYPLYSLEDLPEKPKAVWIVRPPGYTGDGTVIGAVCIFERIIRIDTHSFYTKSGRAVDGRNSLRHGRINWDKTYSLFQEWNTSMNKISVEYHASLQSITDRWQQWEWAQSEENRYYFHVLNRWYAITIYPAIFCFAIFSSNNKKDLYKSHADSFLVTREAEMNRASSGYPFLAESLKEIKSKMLHSLDSSK